jgi:hypothetical protein
LAGAAGVVARGRRKAERRRMSVKLSADEAVLTDARAGQWSAVREKEKLMERMSLGELLYWALVESPRRQSLLES